MVFNPVYKCRICGKRIKLTEVTLSETEIKSLNNLSECLLDRFKGNIDKTIVESCENDHFGYMDLIGFYRQTK